MLACDWPSVSVSSQTHRSRRWSNATMRARVVSPSARAMTIASTVSVIYDIVYEEASVCQGGSANRAICVGFGTFTSSCVRVLTIQRLHITYQYKLHQW